MSRLQNPVAGLALLFGIIVIVVVIAVGNEIIRSSGSGGVGSSTVAEPTCALVDNTFTKNVCRGTCSANQVCTSTKTKRYYYFGREPSACGCIGISTVPASQTVVVPRQ